MKNYQNLCGKVIGSLEVLRLSKDKFDSNKTTKLWECKCKCGKTIYKSTRILNEAAKLNKNLSCGCSAYSDLIGKSFGDYTVKGFSHSDAKNKYWLCQCVCGDISIKTSRYLSKYIYICPKHKKQKSEIVANLKHILRSIKSRCYNDKNSHYKYYGEKGVSVCTEWLNSPNNFIEWALNNGYNRSLTIDRIDNNGNYEPSNCRWVDMFAQANNKSNNINIEYNGKTQSLRKWCRELGLPYRKTHKRLFLYKWSIEKCFSDKERVGFS